MTKRELYKWSAHARRELEQFLERHLPGPEVRLLPISDQLQQARWPRRPRVNTIDERPAPKRTLIATED